MMCMKRTTIMADEDLLDRLRRIARDEKTSLAEVIRQGLELRTQSRPTPLSFIGTGSGEPGGTTGRDAGNIDFEPPEWR